MANAEEYVILECLYESASTRVVRAARQSDRQSVIVKLLKQSELSLEHLERYQHEYDLLRSLTLPHVVKAFDFLRLPEGHALVLEDFGGEALKGRIARQRFTLVEFLDVAIGACEALAEVHLADIIHKDVTPANLVAPPGTGAVKLIDFGISSRLPRLTPALRNPEALEGTLHYIAPEQTGRMNRSLDYRADFYSLGASFFEMLTGQPPFSVTDPAEIVYSHLARRPPEVCELAPEVPAPVGRIIAKLLEKNAEDRYQSAWGIRADLTLCRESLQRGESIADFALASADIPHRFQLAERMYGRQAEIDRLLTAFSGGRGKRQMALISGYSGIGKSTLVREFCRLLTRDGSSMVAGKFDQFQRNTPYSALAAAFGDFVGHALLLGEDHVASLRGKILAAVGENGAVVTSVIPALEDIVGPQPTVAELGGNEAQHRFRLVFQRFIQALCSAEQPLVLFLDDLQWADIATLRLLESLAACEELSHLLLIGAYRDNEVDAAHPLQAMIGRLHERAAPLVEMALTPLGEGDIAALIADSLHSEPKRTLPLAALVHRKTLGNPFFVTQFLQTLYREGLIAYELGDGEHPSGWTWDVPRIESVGITDNVVDLMIARLRLLPEATQAALRQAACIGNTFSLDTLAIIHRSTREVLFDDLMPALQGELLRSVGDNIASDRYSFGHDRIQQAAYALIDSSVRKAVHLDIGRLLLANLSESDVDDHIFEVVDQFNAGAELIADGEERLRLAGLNLSAGERAARANAYVAALEYLDTAVSCLPDDAWIAHHGLALGIFRRRAEVAYLNGDYERSMADIALVRDKAENLLDQAGIRALLITEYTVLGRNIEAVDVAREALAMLGIDVPTENLRDALKAELTPIKEALKDRSIASLYDLPDMTDPVQRMAMKVLMPVHTAAYFAGMRDLYGWFLAKMANLSLRHGHVPESLKGYASLGGVLCGDFGEFPEGYEFAKLAIRLTERFPDNGLKCRASLIMVSFVNHWMRHVGDSDLYLQPGIDAGLEAGEHQFVCYLLMWGRIINQMYRGVGLARQMKQIDEALAFTTKVKNHLATDSILGARAVVANLLGKTPTPTSFDTPELPEAAFLAACAEHNSNSSLCFYHTVRALALYLHGEHGPARESIEHAAKHCNFIASYVTEADVRYLHSLILIALDDRMPRSAVVAAVDANQDKLKRWAQFCPQNFRHKVELVDAERARIENRVGEAITGYDEAIRLAASGGFIHDEALANELAGRFWHGRGKTDFAASHLRRAYRCYQVWGATRKQEHLAQEFAEIFDGGSAKDEASRTPYSWRGPSTASTRTSDNFDLDAIVAAAHLIAGERNLDELKRKLMSIALANAGADRGYLILNASGGLVLEASAEEGGEFSALPSLPLDEPSARDGLPVARSVVTYTARLGSPLVLADACEDPQFGSDPVIRRERTRSLLCLPLIHGGKLSGLLYLENRLARGAFIPAHVRVLEVLASPMAIAIENARIHGNLDELVRTRTAELEETNLMLQREIDERIAIEVALKEAREEAEAATQAKSDFLARMSHEIRTPMNAIIGLSELVQRTELAPKQRDYVRKLTGSANALLGIINAILDFSKIEAGHMTVEATDFALGEVLDNLTNIIVGQAENKGLEILMECGDTVPERLHGDPLRLGQVLINLAGNALKFTHQGEVVIGVHRVADDRGEDVVRFSVRDTGIGMSPAQMENIFQPFHQADGSITRRFGGTGLGLAISRELVELMGGTLQVRSGEGQGTTFWFDLPCLPEEGVIQAKATTGLTESLRVLVVDDNATSRIILKTMLERQHFVVDLAESGEAALEQIQAHNAAAGEPYGLVLMDWRMPGIDGIEATRRIRHDLRLTKMPAILMVTAYGREEIEHEAEKAGIDGFLVKPISEALLGETIDGLFGVSHPAAGTSALTARADSQLAAIRGARILLVEDNPINQLVALELLQQSGMRVDVAADGTSGIAKAGAGHYDLVLMDVQMPDMDGYEATRQIRLMPGLSELPIVAMTAHAQASDRQRSRAAGMFDHLTKPIDVNQLHRVLIRWIKPALRSDALPNDASGQAAREVQHEFPSMPGFDPAYGIAKVGGSESLYVRLLSDFVQAYAEAGDQLAVLIGAREIRRAGLLAHSIKGTAGTLGLSTVAAAAADLESALINEEDHPDSRALTALQGKLAAELAEFCGVLCDCGAVEAQSAPPQSRAISHSMLKAELEQLLVHLDMGSSEAGELLERLRSGADEEWRDLLNRIFGHVEDVEFEDARNLVCELLLTINRREMA